MVHPMLKLKYLLECLPYDFIQYFIHLEMFSFCQENIFLFFFLGNFEMELRAYERE